MAQFVPAALAVPPDAASGAESGLDGFHPPRSAFEGPVRAVFGPKSAPGGPKTGVWNESRPLRPARCRPVGGTFPWLPSYKERFCWVRVSDAAEADLWGLAIGEHRVRATRIPPGVRTVVYPLAAR